MTFGHTELQQGSDFLIAVIGLFGLGGIFLTTDEGLSFHRARSTVGVGDPPRSDSAARYRVTTA